MGGPAGPGITDPVTGASTNVGCAVMDTIPCYMKGRAVQALAGRRPPGGPVKSSSCLFALR